MHMNMDLEDVMTCGKSENTSRCRRSGNCPTGCHGGYSNTCGCERSMEQIVISPNTNCCESKKSWGLHGYPLASVYAPMQSFDNVFDKNIALSKGTIFSELDLPILGASVHNEKGGNCRG